MDDTDVPEAKRAVRATLLAARAARPAEEIEAARCAVRQHVQERATGWRCVAAYRPLRTEPGSVELLDAMRDAGIRVLVPVLLADRDLAWASWDAPEQPPGVSAISEVDAALVPALAVDHTGIRLGRGVGSYDRALRRVAPGVLVAALVYDDEVVADLPAQPWDVRVTAAVTPSGWVTLGRNP